MEPARRVVFWSFGDFISARVETLLIGKAFGGLILQTYLTTDVYEKNYGGHDTRLWGRVIIPLWLPSTPPMTPLYRKG